MILISLRTLRKYFAYLAVKKGLFRKQWGETKVGANNYMIDFAISKTILTFVPESRGN